MKLKLSLKTKIYIVALSAVFILSIYFVTNIYLNVLTTKENDNISELLSIAKSLSLSIDGDEYFEMLKEFNSEGSISHKDQNPFYLKLHDFLRDAKEINNINTEIYTLTYQPKKKHFVYGVTSSDKMKYRHPYHTFPNLLLKNYHKGGGVPRYDDERGTWISAFFPIKNKNGGTVCVIQVDHLFKDFRFEASIAALKNLTVAAVMFILLGIFLYLIISKIVLKEEQLLDFLEYRVTERTKEIEEKNKEISSLFNDADEMNRILRQNSDRISLMNEELVNTLDNLKSTQNQLIQSAKMTSLGQFIAGVAHEINTPLGAINASNDTNTIALEYTLEMLPLLFEILDKKEQTLFFTLLKKGLDRKETLTSREERVIRNDLKSKTAEYCEKEIAEKIAIYLLEIGIHDNLGEYEGFLYHKEAEFIFKVAYYLVIQQRNTNNITIAVGKASKVVTALRTYTKFDHTDRMEVNNIKDSIQTVLTLFHNSLKQGVEVNFEYDDKSHEVFAFGDEINQVWTNIISNAIYAMNGKGKLDVSLKNIGKSLKVKIKDYGVGMSEPVKEKIFEPFFTTKESGEGSGLGLDIVKNIVKRHNGEISVVTDVGEGATFTVLLPIEKQEPIVVKEEE